MKLKVEELNIFKLNGLNSHGSELKVVEVVKGVLLKTKKILEEKGELSYELNYDIKSIITRAYMLDMVFNPIFDKQSSGEMTLNFDLTDSDIQSTIINLNLFQDDIEDEKKENLIYYHTPAIGVFYQGKPLFLNTNYIEALGANNENELKENIIAGKALDIYYKPEYTEYAKTAVSMLSNGDGYKNLVLVTKTGKKISWNSFGNKSGLEIRIGTDITQGQFNTHQTFDEKFEGLDLNTMNLIKGFLRKVNNLIGVDLEINTKLALFGILGTIIDKVWNSGQYLMNVTINDEIESNMLFNPRYSVALKRTKEDILTKIDKGILWKETYDEQTLTLINGLLTILQDEGYYISEFPLKDKNGESSIYSWLRFLIKDNDFGINRTFGIGTNAISKDNAILNNYLK